MIDLYNLKLSDLLPPSIKDDPVISALSKALDSELQAISKLIIETEIMTRIDELPEELIDLLAWQFHVDFYEPLGLDINKKRTLVKNSISWHRKKGTKQLVEEILKVLFIEDYDVIEWFEYNGRPYFFKLETWDNIESEDKYNRLINVIESVKNVRSWLDYILLYKQNRLDVYYGIMNREKHGNLTIPMSSINDTYNEYYFGHLTKETQNNRTMPEALINDTQSKYYLACLTRNTEELITKQYTDIQSKKSMVYLGMLTRSNLKNVTVFDNSINAKACIMQKTFSVCLICIRIDCAVTTY